jgi:elongation factor Ts
MAEVTAGMVKELRETSGAGMMDCKAALVENKGDMQAAVDWLRKKGLSKAAKKAGRVAAEGLIGVTVKGTKGVMVELNSETDFVARNDLFQGLVKLVADVAMSAGTDVEKIKQAKAGSIAVSEAINDTIAKIGVLVGLESSGKADELMAFGRQIAMHVASANPIAVDAGGVDPSVIKREKDILADKFRQQGKPENMIDKIVESGLKTFYKEQTLLDQPFIFDDKKSVSQALKDAEGKVGGSVKVSGFVRFALGEGIEKHESDFAAEVAAAAGQS